MPFCQGSNRVVVKEEASGACFRVSVLGGSSVLSLSLSLPPTLSLSKSLPLSLQSALSAIPSLPGKNPVNSFPVTPNFSPASSLLHRKSSSISSTPSASPEDFPFWVISCFPWNLDFQVLFDSWAQKVISTHDSSVSCFSMFWKEYLRLCSSARFSFSIASLFPAIVEDEKLGVTKILDFCLQTAAFPEIWWHKGGIFMLQ